MNLYIQRHAIAVERGTKGYKRDSDRPLTDKGARKMARIAEGMLALRLSFDAILSSPFVRTRQTAAIVEAAFGAEGVLEIVPSLKSGGDPGELVNVLSSRYGSASNVLIVGHEPYLSGLISVLLSGSSGLSLVMKKGGLCKLNIPHIRYGRCATLEWLLTPNQMSKMR